MARFFLDNVTLLCRVVRRNFDSFSSSRSHKANDNDRMDEYRELIINEEKPERMVFKTNTAIPSTNGMSRCCGSRVEELAERRYYAHKTVKALRRFYEDSLVYFAGLRKFYRREGKKDMSRIENEEEKIKFACFMLKRKYVDSVFTLMPLKNLIDYHIHEMARIQLINLNLRKQWSLLKGCEQELDFEDLSRNLEKILHFTNGFEKNNLLKNMERWQQNLKNRSVNYTENAVSNDDLKMTSSSPVRVLRSAQEIQIRNPKGTSAHVDRLRDELKWRRKEADEENSLMAQIEAHNRYISRTKKDIAELINLDNMDSELSAENASTVKNEHSLLEIADSSRKTLVNSQDERMNSTRSSNLRDEALNSETKKQSTNLQNLEHISGQETKADSFSSSGSHIASVSEKFPNKEDESCRTLNATSLSEKDHSVYLLDDLSRNEQVVGSLIDIHDSSEVLHTGSEGFRKDTSKEVVLTTTNKVDPNDTQKDKLLFTQEDLECRSSSLFSTEDEQFFTPLPSDSENSIISNFADQTVRQGNELVTQISEFFFGSFIFPHLILIQSPVSIQLFLRLLSVENLTMRSPSNYRRFMPDISPIESPINSTSKYMTSLPCKVSSKSSTDSSHSPKVSDHCVLPLAASILSCLVEECVETMLTLKNENSCSSKDANAVFKSNEESFAENSYGESEPKDLIPGLDLSEVEDMEMETEAKQNSLFRPPEQVNLMCDIKPQSESTSLELSSNELVTSFFYDEEWIRTQVESFSKKIWNSKLTKPVYVAVDDPSNPTSQESQLKELIADLCCEVAKHCLKNDHHGCSMGLGNIIDSRPRNVLQFIDLMQKKFSKYYHDSKQNVYKKRWESISRGHNFEIENIVLEELYAHQSNLEDLLAAEQNEIKLQLFDEIWNEQLSESMSAIIF
ncbi:unnamed protein product [Thelazia callipaeda]|uniref:IQ domain-containing protein n=1 Tax=Thelazia callipaeda TaxID=103827 RepID=A0A0N5CMQ3_THECL|nr:unnamed protein product [Thelazia callipaeda]